MKSFCATGSSLDGKRTHSRQVLTAYCGVQSVQHRSWSRTEFCWPWCACWKCRPILILFTIKIGSNTVDTWTQNNRFSMLIHKVPLHGMVGVCCAMSAARIMGLILFWDHKYAPVSYILTLFLEPLLDGRGLMPFPARQCNSSWHKQFSAFHNVFITYCVLNF
jgi:hypothetical protein